MSYLTRLAASVAKQWKFVMLFEEQKVRDWAFVFASVAPKFRNWTLEDVKVNKLAAPQKFITCGLR
jgi:hypothetical protein